MSAPNKLYF